MKTKKEKSYRIRFNKAQIDAILSVAGVIDNMKLGRGTIANFGWIVAKVYKIKEADLQEKK